MEAAKRFQELDKVDQLVYARAVLYHQHLIGYFRYVLRRHFKAGLLVLQEVLNILHFRQLEEGIELPLGVEKDIQGLYFLAAFRCKIGGIAFKYMREVGSQPIDLVAAESMHIVFRH